MIDVVNVEGGIPLIGNVKLSGSRNSALDLFVAAMFCSEDVILENVPKTQAILNDLEILSNLGAKVVWTGQNQLILNGASLRTPEIPYEIGSRSKMIPLLVGPLLFRFGRAEIPLPLEFSSGWRNIGRWVETWESFGMTVEDMGRYKSVKTNEIRPASINFKVSTHRGTSNAILTAISILGETTITNAAEEPEVDDLIDFCNKIGADVVRVEPRKLKITGKNVFKGCIFDIKSDRDEAVTFAVASLITGGNITMSGINKAHLSSFANTLTKIGCKYEFYKDEMRVWHAGEIFTATNIVTSPAPGFMTNWQPVVTLLLTRADGESIIHETIYTDRLDYTKELNRMGAKIQVLKPSDVGLVPIISEDTYDFKKLGEPYTVAKITGPTKLRGTRLLASDTKAGATLVLAALSAEGKSEINDYFKIEQDFENLIDKFTALGARIF